MKDSDSVELKLSIPESAQRSTVMALGMDPLDAQVRLIYFFDTPDLALETRRRGGARAARAPRRRLRGQAPAGRALRAARRRPRLARSAWSRSTRCPAATSARRRSRECRRPPCTRWSAGPAPIRKLFSKQQRAFYAEHAPDGIELDDLSLLGPIFILKLKATPAGYARKMVVELWLYPDGTRLLELSTKCAPTEAFQVAAEARAFLAERGIKTTGTQTTKTRKALQYFSKQRRPRPDRSGQMSRSSRPRATASRRVDTPSLR